MSTLFMYVHTMRSRQDTVFIGYSCIKFIFKLHTIFVVQQKCMRMKRTVSTGDSKVQLFY
jgi:hypothetical protein